jgi:predicted nuclease of predicted toxin-antitoxin system
MAQFLADENIPASAISELRAAGLDVAAVFEQIPGASDESVLGLATVDGRVIITFDKDFAGLAYRRGRLGGFGCVLIRLPLLDADALRSRIVAALLMPLDWGGNLVVVEADRIRVTPLPTAAD